MAEEKTEEVKNDSPWDFDFEDPEMIDAPVEMPENAESDTEVTDEGFSDELVQRAKDAGLDDEDLSNMGFGRTDGICSWSS